MARRRILSLWFPRLAAERAIRVAPQLVQAPFAVVGDVRGALVLASLSEAAEAAGLRRGMGLTDARAICPELLTRPEDVPREATFLAALARWAERYSPWVALDGTEALVLDITGCGRLFGGEAGLVARVEADAAAHGLSLRTGLADTLGAAWAVARFAGGGAEAVHAGDAIDQEARATRARAKKRRWERGGTPPLVPSRSVRGRRIVPPGGARAHIGPLPVAALRLAPEQIAALHGLGLRRIEDVAVLPRAQLARRLGPEMVRRLDQALGHAPEPISPVRPSPIFALRLTFPDPIALETDVLAGIDRLLEPLCARLRAAGQGARAIRLTLARVDRGLETRELGLARPSNTADAIRPLLALKIAGFDAGFGIERLRLEATVVEPVTPRQHRGQLSVSAAVSARQATGAREGMADLLGRIGARLGLEALTRLHPASSHIPEKSQTVMAAGFSEPAADWPPAPVPRPILLFPPEPVMPGDDETPPRSFVWRRRLRRRAVTQGAERIAPEWWLDDPAWRSGPRDYWRVETEDGDRLWLYKALGGETPSGWFVQGVFA